MRILGKTRRVDAGFLSYRRACPGCIKLLSPTIARGLSEEVFILLRWVPSEVEEEVPTLESSYEGVVRSCLIIALTAGVLIVEKGEVIPKGLI